MERFIVYRNNKPVCKTESRTEAQQEFARIKSEIARGALSLRKDRVELTDMELAQQIDVYPQS